MDWDLILLDLVMTVFFYLLVPVVLCIRHKPMSEKQINKVVIINGIVVWLAFTIIIISVNGETSSIPAVFLWSWVGKKIMERVLVKAEENESASESTNEINDVTDKAAIDNQFPQTRYYCSKCGGLIDDNTRKCTECGKQHSKKLSKTSITLIVVSVLLVVVCVAWGTSVVQSRKTTTTTTNEPPNSPNSDEMSFSEWVVAREVAGIMSGDPENFDYLESYYFDCIVEAYEIAGEGNMSYEQAQDAVIDYLNDIDIEYGEKIIIYRLIYQYDNQYNSEIIEYLNGRYDISYDDEAYILQKLGMTVDSDGNVSWE